MRWKALLTELAVLLFIVPAIAAAVSGTGSTEAAVWGYDLPYSYAYGAGVPFYTGHDNGDPSGGIYEKPALYPDGAGATDPAVIRGQPENAMDLNFSHAFPSMSGLIYGSRFSPFTFTGL